MKKYYDFKKLNMKYCSPIVAIPDDEVINLYGSNIAKSVCGLPGETWPMIGKKPMNFICQINLCHAPFVPKILEDIDMITFFIDIDKYLSDRKNSWCLRAYKDLSSLIELDIPSNGFKNIPCDFKYDYKTKDYPFCDNPYIATPKNFSNTDIIDYFDKTDRIHVGCSKLGGWPSEIQYYPNWSNEKAKPEFCMQIDYEEDADLIWIDGGCLYIGRGTATGYEDEWFIDIQFH